MTTLEKITAKEANQLVADYSGKIFVAKVYGMIRKAAKCGGNMTFLYNEETTFLSKNIEFQNELKNDGFKIETDKVNNRLVISW